MVKDSYEWVDDWGNRERSEKSISGWAHPGMATTSDGNIVTCDSGESLILVFSQDGLLLDSWNGNFSDAHGITIATEGSSEVIWIADNGSKRQPGHAYDYAPEANTQSGRVFKTAFGGEELMELPMPDHTAYANTKYSPTSVGINKSNNDIWVADGYGASLVHRFAADGKYLQTIDGSNGAGLFSCPHGIAIDYRKSEAELFVADRSNSRVQVYDLEGNFKRSFGTDFLTTPSGFAFSGDLAIISELRSRLAVVDKNDNLVNYLFPNPDAPSLEGWPNEMTENGVLKRPASLESGKFNSPHGMTVDHSGNIYVAEWLIGGRFTKLNITKDSTN